VCNIYRDDLDGASTVMAEYYVDFIGYVDLVMATCVCVCVCVCVTIRKIMGWLIILNSL
jgi:hypothetical protein